MSSKDSEAHLAEIHRKLEAINMAPTARDWLVKALHPAATHECPGIPDQFEGQIITPDYRDSVVVGPDPAVTGNWDMLVVQIPGDVNGFLYATGPSGTNFTGTSVPVDCTANVTWNQTVVPGVGAPATAVTVAAGVTPPEATIGITPVMYAQVAAGPWEWRRRYAGITAYMTASALNDQGTVFASSFPSKFVRGGPVESITVDSAGTPLPGLAVSHAWNIPLDETSLQLVSPKPYVAPARHGCYVPARFMDYDMNLVEMIKTGDVVRPRGVSGADCSFAVLPDFPGGHTAIPCTTFPRLTNGRFEPAWPSNGYGGATNNNTTQTDSGHSGMTATVMIFRGLARDARITVRSYYGLEMVPTIYSSFRQFCKPAPPYSEVALRTYAAVVHELAYAYPASYNSWGDILGVIHSVANALYPAVRPLISSIPVVGKAVTSVGDALLGHSTSQAHVVAPHMSETQRVSTSDPRPAARPALVVRASSAKRASCQQCKMGLPHKHKLKRTASVSSRRSVLSRRR